MTCQERGYACCDHFPPEIPVYQMTEEEAEEYYVWHVQQFEMEVTLVDRN